MRIRCRSAARGPHQRPDQCAAPDGNPGDSRLRPAGAEPNVIGDNILLEVLQRVSNEARAQAIEGWLRRFTLVPMPTEALAIRAVAHCRRLRGLNITPRGMANLLIAGWCIAHAVPLLHADRDFDRIAGPLGLPIQPV